MKGLEHILAWYEKDPGSNLIGSVKIDIAMQELQKLYRLDEEMIACYDVEPHHVSYLQQFTKHQIQLDKYDYFVEGQATKNI